LRKKFTAGILCSAFLCSGLQMLPANAEEAGLQIGHFENYAQYENAAQAGRLISANESHAPDAEEVLPSSFDLRSLGLVSSVKSQESYGMCWSFAAINSIENGLIARKPEIDLSEWHLAYYTYSPKFGFPLKRNTDMDDVFNQGGNFYLLSPMLTSWLGPVSESLFPFNDTSVLDPDTDWETIRTQAEYHVSDANLFTYHIEDDNFSEQLAAVKSTVYQGHAMSASYYNKSICHDTAHHSYFFSEKEKKNGTYHAISIVGWDDDFPAENFLTSPGGDGAFLVKNSWGTDWGDYGYFWISYYDPSILEFYYLKTEPVQKHDKIYQYDDYGYWTAFSVSAEEESVSVANVFTAEKDTYLTSVMLCNAMPDEQYSIRIYSNPTRSTNPATGVASAYTVGTLREAGYHTIDLISPVALQAGEKFSIVVKLSGASGQHIVCEAYTRNTVTQPDGAVSVDATIATEEMIQRDFHQGESFYSADGRKWYDIYNEEVIDESYTMADGTQVSTYATLGNICVRGLTQDAGVILFSEQSEALPVGTEISLSSPGSTEIYFSINDGEYQLYTEPIPMPDEPVRILAYAMINHEEFPIYEKNYSVQEAQLSSILYIEDGKEHYLQFEQTGLQQYETVCLPDENAVICLLPITTGQITLDGEQLLSGKMTEIQWEDKISLVLNSSQEGMLDTKYIIHLSEPETLPGDVNGDSEVNASDAAEILVYAALAGTGTDAEYPERWISLADFNQDGEINAADASEILVYAVEHAVS